MMYHLQSDETDPHAAVLDLSSHAALIHVAACEQQEPAVLHCCPVCGQPYLPDSLLALHPPANISFDKRLVFACARCGTYSVGMLDAQHEAGRCVDGQNGVS